MAETFVVETRGIGKPDYTREVSSGEIRPGLTLKYRQSLKMWALLPSNLPSPLVFVVPPIGAGLTAHLVDAETNLPLPSILPAGYIYTLVQIGYGFNQDVRLPFYFGTPPGPTFFAGYLSTSSSGASQIWSDVTPFSSALFDPTAAFAHVFDGLVENLGGGDMIGNVSLFLIAEAVGTPPPPSTKRVRCKFCSYEWEVPVETTSIQCPKCDELNIYLNLRNVRKL